jgi:release factor glutamine methyltransferase
MYLHLPEELTAEQEAAYFELLRRRIEHRPTAYLTGAREFYGIEFYVAPGVLIPRPETELLVEESLRLLRDRSAAGRTPVFVDVGTGSGAIVVAAAKNWPNARYIGTDTSAAALQVATLNAKRPRLAGRIELLHGDLLEAVSGEVDVIAANLPYIPTAVWQALPPEIRDHEPRHALDGGDDGLDLIRRLIWMAPSYLRPTGALLLEIGDGQAATVLELLAESFPGSRRYTQRDLSGIERVVVVDCGVPD